MFHSCSCYVRVEMVFKFYPFVFLVILRHNRSKIMKKGRTNKMLWFSCHFKALETIDIFKDFILHHITHIKLFPKYCFTGKRLKYFYDFTCKIFHLCCLIFSALFSKCSRFIFLLFVFKLHIKTSHISWVSYDVVIQVYIV